MFILLFLIAHFNNSNTILFPPTTKKRKKIKLNDYDVESGGAFFHKKKLFYLLHDPENKLVESERDFKTFRTVNGPKYPLLAVNT